MEFHALICQVQFYYKKLLKLFTILDKLKPVKPQPLLSCLSKKCIA